MKEELALVNLASGEIIYTGEELHSVKSKKDIEILKKNIILKKGVVNKTMEPFTRVSKNQIVDEIVDSLPTKDQARLYKLIRMLNTKNRISYGTGPNQVCKDWNDLIKIKELDLTDRTLKTFRQNLMKKDIIREITTNQGKKYIIMNPLFVVNGKYFDPIVFIFFKDVIVKHEILTSDEIKLLENNISNSVFEFQEGR
ncbi:hypothetical protein [Cetobacterium sp.]|uniref:hypothetical protein n=1 Tax=Cetobacterium sp. TaxID=2071632 RepID=UPI003F3FC0C4